MNKSTTKIRWINFLPLALGGGLSVALMFAKGISSADTMGSMRILSDSFFVSGVLILGFAILSFAKGQGAFDMLIYSFSLLAWAVGFKKPRYNSYAEFISRERRKGGGKLFLSGLIILSLSLIFLLMYFILS